MQIVNEQLLKQIAGGAVANGPGCVTDATGMMGVGAIVGAVGGPVGAAAGALIGLGYGASESANCAPSTVGNTSQSISGPNSVSNSNGTAGNAGTVGTPSGCTPGNNPSAVTCGPVGDDVSGGGGGGGGGKVICTELCRNGVIEHDVWMADLDYSRKHFSEQTMRGYHLWGVPYVKLMRKSPLFAKLAQYPTQAFAQDIAYRMGVVAKPNYMGWALRELAFRPVCWSIGVFAKARDFQHLWTGKTLAA